MKREQFITELIRDMQLNRHYKAVVEDLFRSVKIFDEESDEGLRGSRVNIRRRD